MKYFEEKKMWVDRLKADGKENQRRRGRAVLKSGHLTQPKYKEQTHKELWKRQVVEEDGCGILNIQ